MTSASAEPQARERSRRRYQDFQRFFKAYLRLWSILVYLGIYQSACIDPFPCLQAMASCHRLVLHPALLGGSRCSSTSGSQVRGQGSSTERHNDVQTDRCAMGVCVHAWRWLNGWKETVRQWEIWKQFDCIKAFQASPLISLLASCQYHTHPLLCAAGRSTQKAFHHYAFTCLFASSFTHLFIHLFICCWLYFDSAVIYVITNEVWLILHVCTCSR